MTQRTRPIMGLSNLPFGLYGGVMLAAIPQLLSSKGVPEPDIASITAIGLSPNFFYFLTSPILDVRFSRKIYATVLGFMEVESVEYKPALDIFEACDPGAPK